MTLYHGSPTGALTQLIPSLSEHNKPYIYFSSNPVVALLYAVKPVPKPFSFYPYGFGSNGEIIYSEYFKNSFESIYKGQVGYIYECDNVTEVENPTQISCAYTVTKPVEINRVTEILDCYEQFKEYEKQGLFRIRAFEDISANEMKIVSEDFENYIHKYDLRNNPDNEMSLFIKTNFPHIWDVKK